MYPDSQASRGRTLAVYICELADAEPAKRAAAAAELFRLGRDLAQVATSAWFHDPKLAALLLDRAGFPLWTVGLAVERDTFASIRAANGMPHLADVSGIDEHSQDVEECELDFPDGVRLDILTTTRPGAGGAIDRFLRKFGEGIQQVELQTRDIDTAVEILRGGYGVSPVYPKSRPGANGTHVNFFLLPSEPGTKILIELFEAPRQSRK